MAFLRELLALFRGSLARTDRLRGPLLEQLAGRPQYGLQLRDAIWARMDLDLTGVIYVHLHRLEDEGLIASWEEPGGRERGGLPRRVYRITPAGRAWLEGRSA
jgi:DNA-binding PadR family transcriptional regulator